MCPLFAFWWNRRRFAYGNIFRPPLGNKLPDGLGSNVNPIRHFVPSRFSSYCFAVRIFFALLLASELDALCGENVNPIRVQSTRAGSTNGGLSKRDEGCARHPSSLFGGTDGS